MYHCTSPEKVEQAEAPSAMEVNEALELVADMFPPETGLYKKGAHFQEKIVKMYFDFPIVQVEAQSGRIKDFENHTGWKIEVNSECRLAAAENLITKLLKGSGAIITKNISYYREDKSFTVTTTYPIVNKEDIKQSFHNETGLYIKFSDEIEKEIPNTSSVPGQMEQNKAFEYIDQYFSDKPHKPYKKSLKVKNGERGIELSFLTCSLGNRYLDDIDKISAHIYWNIWISPTANQHELLKIAVECLTSHGVAHKKLSFLPDTQSVQATVHSKLDEETLLTVSESFQTKTGVDILIT
jgi:hypothetical protein